ncbi:MAG TPA: hypothetical protein VK772_17730 [Puia sp.]|jgi:hypothetical protein|nr:hypothetical protein [Puia sp.]
MKKISRWAKSNKRRARTIIVLIHFALIILGMLTGWLLFKINFYPSTAIFYEVLFICILTFFIYPKKGGFWQSKFKSRFYIIQKSCDLILAFGGFLMISFCSENTYAPSTNKILFLPVNLLYASHGANPKSEELLQSLKSRSRKDLNRSEKKILKHEFFREVKVYVKAKATGDNETAVKAFLVIVTIAVAVGLTYLLAGLACSLSCSGAQGLAALVMIGGLVVLIFGSIVLTRAIMKIGRKKQLEDYGQFDF